MIYALLASIIYFHLFFWWSLIKRNISVIDIAWGGGFFVVWLAATIQSGNWTERNMLVGGLTFVWALRLMSYLYSRIKRMGEDFRYQEIAADWKGSPVLNSYFKVYWLQNVLLLLTSIPLISLATTSSKELGRWDIVPLILWIIGFAFEAVSDWQKNSFKRDAGNKDKVCKQGLWRYSRHPNYFGEALLWWAIFIFSISSEVSIFLLALSPVLLTFLLLKVSGIPFLARKNFKNPEYVEYAKRTNAFFPWFPREVRHD